MDSKFRLVTAWDRGTRKFVRTMHGTCSDCGDSTFNWQLHIDDVAVLTCVRCGNLHKVSSAEVTFTIGLREFERIAKEVQSSLNELCDGCEDLHTTLLVNSDKCLKDCQDQLVVSQDRVRVLATELGADRLNLKSQIKSWKDYSEKTRRDNFFGGAVVGAIAGAFAAMFILCDVLPVATEVVERPTGVTVAEYKQVVKSLDRCNERERDHAIDAQDEDHTWDRLFMLEHLMDDAPGDFDRAEANRICEKCESNAEQALQDYKFDQEEYCWCPYGGDTWLPSDPWRDPVSVDMENMLDNMCTELEGGSVGETSSSLGLAWMRGCVGVNGRNTRDFDAFFQGYEWGMGQ